MKKGGFLSYLEKEWLNLKNSFKAYNIKALLTLVYDSIFYIFSIASIFLYFFYIDKQAAKLNLSSLDEILLDAAKAKELYPHLQKFIFFDVFFCFILLVVVVFVVMALTKLKIWSEITNNKANKKDSLKFIGIRFVWSLIMIPAYAVIVPASMIFIALLKAGAYPASFIPLIIIIVIFLLMSNTKIIMYIDYLKTKNFSCIPSSFKIGFKKAHKFILPYIVSIILFILFIQLSNLFFFASDIIQGYIAIFLMVLYFSWFRLYIYEVSKTI